MGRRPRRTIRRLRRRSLVLRHWASTGTSPWAGGYDAVNYGGSILKAIKAAGGEGWFPFSRDATDAAVAEAHALGLKVGAWTVDDPARDDGTDWPQASMPSARTGPTCWQPLRGGREPQKFIANWTLTPSGVAPIEN